MKLDFLQVWPKPSGYHICVVVAHLDVLMSTDISCLTLACALAFFREDICNGFAFHAMKDDIPNSLYIINIHKK